MATSAPPPHLRRLQVPQPDGPVVAPRHEQPAPPLRAQPQSGHPLRVAAQPAEEDGGDVLPPTAVQVPGEGPHPDLGVLVAGNKVEGVKVDGGDEVIVGLFFKNI